MGFIADTVRDDGLNHAKTSGTRLDICSSEPATYAAAVGAASLGNKTGLALTGPADAASGRKVSIPIVTDGNVTAAGTATHWALTDGVGELIATGDIAPDQVVTDGNTWKTTAAIDLSFPDVA